MRDDTLSDNSVNSLSIKKKELILKIIVYVVSSILVLITMYPFILLFVEFTGFSTKDPANMFKVLGTRGKEFVEFFKSDGLKALINTLIISFSSTILNVYFAALTAHGINAYKWKFRKIFSNFVLILMMIPTVVASAGFVQLAYRFHLNNKLILFILPAIATPVSVVFMRLYLESSFPMELLYSARIDGAGEFRIFNQIVLPILKPAIATQAIFGFASSWNDAGLPRILLTDKEKFTLPIAIMMGRTSGNATIVILVSTVPLLVVFLILSRYIVEGVELGCVKM